MSTRPDNAVPLLLKPAKAARLIGVSRTVFYRLHNSGAIPLPVKVGRVTYWRAGELRDWVNAGTPPRVVWQARRGA